MRGWPTALLLLAVPSLAHAHGLGTIQVSVEFARAGTYAIDIAIDPEHVPPLTAVGPVEQTRYGRIEHLSTGLAWRLGPFLQALANASTVAFDDQAVTPHLEASDAVPDLLGTPRPLLRMTGAIPAGARTFTWRNDLPIGTYPIALRNEGDETASYQWLVAERASAPFTLAAAVRPPTTGEVVRQYLALGFTHILPKGTDHILFVLGIFLLSLRLRPMLTQVTAFTVAHTITLGLTIYGVVALSPRIVEPLIAVSIVYVAVENVLTRELRPSRVALVFGFGLLHGMGFAGVLRELGLPRSQFLPALVAFNLGVEGGQLTVIAVAFLLIGLPFRHRPWYRSRVVVPASCAIAAIGAYWAIQRTLG